MGHNDHADQTDRAPVPPNEAGGKLDRAGASAQQADILSGTDDYATLMTALQREGRLVVRRVAADGPGSRRVGQRATVEDEPRDG